jgi:hypothetical protein
MRGQIFAPVPRQLETGRAVALRLIEDSDASCFDLGLCNVAGVGEPKLKGGAVCRILASYWFHRVLILKG